MTPAYFTDSYYSKLPIIWTNKGERKKDGQNNFISGSHQGKGNEEDQKCHGGKK
jgi:hypothetical protein